MIQKFRDLPVYIRHLSVIFTVALVVCLPALIAHYPDTHDTIFAFMAFRSFSEQFYAGEFYPRWLFDFYNFYGAPMFYYYPPLIFYFEVIIDIITLRFLPDLLILGVTAFVMILGSGIACYYWLKHLFGAQKAFIPSVIYMILPNHLAIDLYLKGTLTELSSYIWMPLLFLFINKSFKDKRGWIVVAALYAALITSTIPMALALTPLLLAYIGYEIYERYLKTQQFEIGYLKPLGALCVGFSLAGFHIVTAYLMTDYINQDKFWDAFYDPRTWFMCFFDCSASSGEPISLMFSWLHSVQMLVIFSLFLFCWKNQINSRLNSVFWFIMAAGATFMMTKYSWFLWDYIPLIERIQFPWRLAVVLDITLVLFLAKTFPFSNIKFKSTELFAVICILGFTAIGMKQTYSFYDRDMMYPQGVIQEHWEKRDYFGVYIPPFTDVTRMDLVDDTNIGKVITIKTDSGSEQIIEYQKIPYGKEFEISHNTPVDVYIRQLFYPTWTAYSQETGQQFPLSVSEPMGNIVLSYPGGTDTIVLKHKLVWQEKTGWGFTVVALLVLLFGWRRNRKVS